MPTYAELNQRHPDVDVKYWEELRGLYRGGAKLLHNQALMKRVFPPHLVEDPTVYKERLARAYYMPYVGQIVDQIVSGLFSDPLRLEDGKAEDEDDGEDEEDDDTESEAGELDPFYRDFLADCSPPGGRRVSFDTFLRGTILDALQVKRAWSLAELPKLKTGAVAPVSQLDEDVQGLRNAYLCRVPSEDVYDWEEDESGELEWAIVHDEKCTRSGVAASRNSVTETWMVYFPDHWDKYSITYEKGKPPQDKDEVSKVDSGPHSFGRVPLIPLDLGDGFWALDRLAGLAKAHLNKRNALSWAEYKSLFPILTHSQQEINPMQPLTEDPNRVSGNTVGQGYVVKIAEKDRLEYVSPDSAPYQTALADLGIIRDEMFRIIHHMALSVDNSGAALQRSADSKQVDKAATAVFLKELGHYVRQHAIQLLEMIADGRKDEGHTWRCEGMEKYKEETLDTLLGQADKLEKMESVRIPSPTFQRRYRYQLAVGLLGSYATEKDRTEIAKELQRNITDEEMEPGADMEARIEEESRVAQASVVPPEDDE